MRLCPNRPTLATHCYHRRQRRRGRDPPIFDLQGSSYVDDPPPIFRRVLFFLFSGTSGTNWYFYKVYHTSTIHGTHESLKKQHTQNAPYHTVLRWKIHKFSGKGHSLTRMILTHSPTVLQRRRVVVVPGGDWRWQTVADGRRRRRLWTVVCGIATGPCYPRQQRPVRRAVE